VAAASALAVAAVDRQSSSARGAGFIHDASQCEAAIGAVAAGIDWYGGGDVARGPRAPG